MYQTLLVEDDLTVAKSIQNTFEKVKNIDVEIELAESLTKAIENLNQKQYDLILIDLNLPESSGLDTLNQISPYSNGTALIVLADPDSSLETYTALEREAVDYIIKAKVSEQYIVRAVRCAIKYNQLENELRQCHQLGMVGKLMGGVVHDLKNYFNIVLMFCEYCESTLEDDNPAKMYLKEIKKCTMHSSDLVKNILMLSRNKTLRSETVYPDGIIRGMEIIIQSQTGKHIEFNMQLNLQNETVNINPSLFEQFLLNLVMNAVDAMKTTGTLTIRTVPVYLQKEEAYKYNIKRDGDYVCIEVEDTGHGMEAHIIDRIFEPLFTTKPEGKGTGYGLFNVRKTIREHGGFIKVISMPNQGATFQVFLPVVNSHKIVKVA